MRTHPQLRILCPGLEPISAPDFSLSRTPAQHAQPSWIPGDHSLTPPRNTGRPVADSPTCRNIKSRSPAQPRRGTSQFRWLPSIQQYQSLPRLKRQRQRQRRPPDKHNMCTTKWKLIRMLVSPVRRPPRLVPSQNQTQICLGLETEP